MPVSCGMAQILPLFIVIRAVFLVLLCKLLVMHSVTGFNLQFMFMLSQSHISFMLQQ